MLQRSSIGKRLALAFGLIALILILAVGIAVRGFRSLQTGMDDVKMATVQSATAKNAHAHILQAMIYIGAVTGAEDPGKVQAYLALVAEQRAAYKADIETMKRQARTPEIKEALAALEQTIALARDANTQALDAAKQGRHKDATRIYAEVSCPNIALWNPAFSALSDRLQALMDAGLGKAEADVRRNTWIILAAGAAAILAACLLGLTITRSIVRPIQGFLEVLSAVAKGDLTVKARVDSRDEIGRLGDALNHALDRLRGTIKEVASASASVASGATQLAASAEEMSATTQEIAKRGEVLRMATDSVAAAIVEFLATVEQVAGNVKVSVDYTEKAVAATESGAKGGLETEDSMTRIHETTTRITKGVSVIREIARQTNLLSLNAAIEAAKAGSSGKGFAVVADEIRKLAERSREATVEIAKLLEDTDSAVQGGVSSVRNSSGLMERIQALITNMSSQVREIGTATNEQSATAVEIAKRMEDSAQEVGRNAAATHQLSASVQEISSTAQALSRISETMTRAVAQFQY